MNPLLEQAARVLDHQPTRSMEAESLYRKAARECGVDLPYPQFLEALRRATGRFAVIEPDPLAGMAQAWDARYRSLYQAALEAAGLSRPVVVLAERIVEQDDPDGRSAGREGAEAVLGDVHDALTHLLRTADADDSLYAAVANAVEELHALQRQLLPGRADTRAGAA